MIGKLDAIGIPSTDWERSREFYVDTLGLRPDPNARAEFWIGETCFAINSIALLHVDLDTGVCHMATFFDPDRNRLTLHKRYAPYA